MLMRLAAHRADGEYVGGYVDASAKALHAMVGKFFLRAAPARLGAAGFTLYAAPTTSAATPGVSVRRLGRREDPLVENAALRLLDPVCARALGLRAGEIALNRTRAAYRRVGLVRAREAFGAFVGDRCVAILLQEEASPGLCLSGLMSAATLLPVLPDLDPDGAHRHALCALARGGDITGGAPNRFLFVPTGADEAPIAAAGFRPIGTCTFFAFHRLALLEYQRYVASRYGLLQARLRGRPARVPEAA
jgi:hypothetical protein